MGNKRLRYTFTLFNRDVGRHQILGWHKENKGTPNLWFLLLCFSNKEETHAPVPSLCSNCPGLERKCLYILKNRTAFNQKLLWISDYICHFSRSSKNPESHPTWPQVLHACLQHTLLTENKYRMDRQVRYTGNPPGNPLKGFQVKKLETHHLSDFKKLDSHPLGSQMVT